LALNPPRGFQGEDMEYDHILRTDRFYIALHCIVLRIADHFLTASDNRLHKETMRNEVAMILQVVFSILYRAATFCR
jgi:hypothetical protein